MEIAINVNEGKFKKIRGRKENMFDWFNAKVGVAIIVIIVIIISIIVFSYINTL